jgi:eukaryotic-like serine/threonine-protein kinase
MNSVDQKGQGEFTLASVPPGPATEVFGLSTGVVRGTVALPGVKEPAPGSNDTCAVPQGAATSERFEKLETIGEGGMGNVYRVLDVVLQRELAMKVIRPEAEILPELAARFLAEAQVTAQLDHPGIVPVHDMGADEGGSGLFFTMKRVSGVTLSDVVVSLRGTNPKHEVLKRLVGYVIKVCHALEFAHARGVLHCDIKPANIMVGDFDQVYLMDWGVAVVREAPAPPLGSEGVVESPPSSLSALTSSRLRATTKAGIVGTPAYMAPEQSKGQLEALDARTDVYGLGGVLYEILCGKAPNQRRSSILPGVAEVAVALPQAGDIWDELPPGLVQVTLQALNQDRELRQGSVQVLRAQLESFLDGGGWFETQGFRRGEVIVRQGDLADTAYIIESGYCEVFVKDAERQTSVGRLGPGDVFGETAALSTGVRTASVVALGDVIVRVVTRESLDNELSRNPWLGAFVRALGRRHRELEHRLNERA